MFGIEEAIDLLRWGGYDVVKRKGPRTLKNDPERWALVQHLVESEASQNEIQRSTGADPRTLRKYFPDYRPFPVGGGGEAQTIRQVNQDLERLDKHGNLGTRRGRT